MEFKFLIPMILSLAVMIWGILQLRQGKDFGRIVSGVAGALCVFLAICSAVYSMYFKKAIVRGKQTAVTHSFLQIKHEVFGKHVAEKQKGKKAIIIYDKPGDSEIEKTNHKLTVEEFKKQISGSIEIVGKYEWVYENTDVANIEQNLLTANKLEDILRSFNGFDLIISFIGLPIDFKNMSYWRRNYRNRIPQFVILNSNPREFKPAIVAGHFVSILAKKPIRIDHDAPVPDDPNTAFDSRFIIITPENVDALHKQYPHLFIKGE
ncbi:MAG: hypothetical protein HRT89_09570 [Lentisphaeria bacterium]|nr:hypothetical protein [Lentisphaeria bacterium]NQZ68309.1 hypothetical protein [Lentisphaeria bacterium]